MTEVKSIVRPEGGYGWVIILACVVINCTLLPLVQCFGIIYESKFHDMNITAAEISFLLHLNNAIMCSLGLFSGPLLKKFNYRQVAFIGASFIWLGIFFTTFATTYGSLIFTVGIMQGIGHGILMPATYLSVNSYFRKRLTLAISFQVTGVSIFPIFMPHVCNFLLDFYGTQGTVLILAGIALHAFPCVILLRPIKVQQSNTQMQNVLPDRSNNAEEQSDLLPAERVYQETTVKKEKKRLKLCRIFNLELFSDRIYLILVIGMGITFVSELNIVLMIPFMLAELANFSRQDVALALSLQATFDVIGRLVVPLIAHKKGWSPKVMYACSLIGSSFGRTGVAMFHNSRNTVLASTGVIGLSKGIKAVFQSLILPKYISFDKLAAATGLSMVMNGILSLAIGPLIGFTHDISNSYVYPLHTATIISILCIILWIIDDIFKPASTTNEATDEPA